MECGWVQTADGMNEMWMGADCGCQNEKMKDVKEF